MAAPLSGYSEFSPIFGGILLPENDNLGHLELDSNCLQIQQSQRLGEGHYGEVRLAYWLREPGIRKKVAMKTAKMSKTLTQQQLQTQIDSILKEIEVMAHIGKHEYVLHLIGAVTKTIEHFCMVTEFCEFGSLENFLQDRNYRNQFVDEIITIKYENITTENCSTTMFIAQTMPQWSNAFRERRKEGKITTSDLLAFSYQIATGMIFLQGKRILHRDLALRNILLKADFNIKIADFGLSRILTSNGLYEIKSPDIALPIHHLPPESEFGGAVNLKADWWTFGVLLWQIFQLGAEEPFKNQSRLSMITFLEDGNRLNNPKYAPREIFEMMIDLWNSDPDDRVGLTECHRKLKTQLKISCLPLANELFAIDEKIQQQQQSSQTDRGVSLVYDYEESLLLADDTSSLEHEKLSKKFQNVSHAHKKTSAGYLLTVISLTVMLLAALYIYWNILS